MPAQRHLTTVLCFVLPLALGWAAVPRLASGEDPVLSSRVDFQGQIAPLLTAQCAGCHDGPKPASGLSLTSPETLFLGGKKNGAVVYPGKGRFSPIVQYLRGDRGPRMPLGGAPQPALADLMERWIDQGALVDGRPPAVHAPVASGAPPGWPFEPPARVTPPTVRDRAWVRNPIDAFVLARLEARGLHPAPEADRRTLIRRVAFDLTGLPPTQDEIARYLSDAKPGAYERMVDRYLASPGYGERWGRHWLDLARYADSNGFEGDETRGFAWRYRDYVIRSFNADKPYDRFVKEQLAGDELYPGDADALVATAFIRNGPWDSLAFDMEQQRADFLTDVTDTTGAVFLGLTVGCARCHDHKYDPIPTRDYYRLQAFFTQVKLEDRALPADPKLPGPDGAPGEAMVAVDWGRDAGPHHVLLRGDIHTPGEPVYPGFPVCLAGSRSTPRIVPPAGLDSTGRRSALANWIASPGNPQTARVMVNRVWQYHFGRGIVGTPSDFGRNGDPPSNPELLDWLTGEFVAGRTPGIEPQRHEGTKAARSGCTLGYGTSAARRPRTMDAATARPNTEHRTPNTERPIGRRPNDLYACAWRLKALHRLILTSSTYRQSSRYDAAAARVDPDDRLLWRFNRQRLEGEEIRDAMLAVSGRLNRKIGGPGVFPTVQKEVLDTGSTHKWGHSAPDDQLRRSIYVFQRRSLVLPLIDVFDGADLSNTCPRRAVTTIAPQALALLNGRFARSEAAAFAARVAREAGPLPERRVQRAYLLAMGRPPSAAEARRCAAFLVRQSAIYRGSPVSAGQGAAAPAARAALTDLCHVLYNTNEFAYLE